MLCLKGQTAEQIKQKIQPFTDPELTMSHGRGIYADKAKDCGLNVETIDPEGELWQAVWGLYMRSKYVVDATKAAKLVETTDMSLVMMSP